ncbi:DNA-directed RNA polymerase subunit omega [bacterium]|nr:DNA-directed RNA polymerase subunit omega [bacterium]
MNNMPDDQKTTDSVFQLVMAVAKRSKQLNRMSKERGLPPNQVASIKTRHIKPPTIALDEFMYGKIIISSKASKGVEEKSDDLISEESSHESNGFTLATSN